MLILRNHTRSLNRVLLLLPLLLMASWARTQGAVYVLKAKTGDVVTTAESTTESGASQSFELHRNLIFFPARLNGRTGNFILDTGAPTLLVNRRGEIPQNKLSSGYGAGGKVAINPHRVESLEFAGQRHGRTWALALDLRGMEARTGRTIDGFIGYEQLSNRELRIDYAGEDFSIRKSVRRPQHDGRSPDSELDLDFAGHLPLVTLRFGKRRLKFILDTGAAVNLIDEAYADLTATTGKEMNIEGLDGDNRIYPLVRLPDPQRLSLSAEQRSFVRMDLSHLQETDAPPIAGILGSAFLEKFAVGIDYRRRKLYIWNPSK